MFENEEELKKFVYNHTYKPNQKYYLKYYIDKNLYKLFSYCIIYPNNWEIEFYTLDNDFEKIWKKMKKYEDYGYTVLIDNGYDKNYHCYVVSVHCPMLIDYLRSMHNYGNPMGEKIWKEKVKNCNWNNYEIETGYLEYRRDCDDWFKLHLGAKINL